MKGMNVLRRIMIFNCLLFFNEKVVENFFNYFVNISCFAMSCLAYGNNNCYDAIW